METNQILKNQVWNIENEYIFLQTLETQSRIKGGKLMDNNDVPIRVLTQQEMSVIESFQETMKSIVSGIAITLKLKNIDYEAGLITVIDSNLKVTEVMKDILIPKRQEIIQEFLDLCTELKSDWIRIKWLSPSSLVLDTEALDILNMDISQQTLIYQIGELCKELSKEY